VAPPRRFVVDMMLGKLARWLRAMGYDTLYFKFAEDRHLLQLAHAEARTLLTRDARLARLAGAGGLLIHAMEVEPQVTEVIQRLALSPGSGDLLSRCLECNTPLADQPKDSVRGRVPAYVFATHDHFVGCPGCGRIYWQGSHADRMLARLGRVLGASRPTLSGP
jgi:uncharacterized protein